MGLDLEVAIELLGMGATAGAGAVTYARSAYKFDAADYDGATYYFEVVATNTSGTTDYDITLYDQTTGGAAVTVTVVKSNSTVKRFRSASFTPASGVIEYRVKTPAVSSGTTIVYTARILVVQKSATKTELCFPLTANNYDQSGTWDDASASVFSQSSTYYPSFTLNTGTANLFKRDDSLLDAIASGSPWTFSCVIANNNPGATTYATLVNGTDGVVVSAFWVSSTGDTAWHYVSASAAGDATNFHSADAYYYGTAIGGNIGYLARAEVRVKLTSLTKAYVYKQICRASPYNTVALELAHQRTLHTDANWQSGYTVHLEGAGYLNESADHCAASGTSGDSGNGTPVSPYINWNSASWIRRYTTDLSLTDGYTYIGETNATSGNQFVSGLLLVYVLGAGAGAAPTGYMTLRRGMW